MEKISRSVMVLASHPDDAEIGMGGTIAALQSSGIAVNIIDLSDGEPTPYGSIEKRAAESKAASSILDVSTREMLGLKNREIFDTVENRKLLAAAIRRCKPEIMFIPYWEDGHPDHISASALGIAARFYAKLSNTDIAGEPVYPRKTFFYFCTHIRPKVIPSFIFDISAHFEAKMSSIRAYKSQFADNPKNAVFLDTIIKEASYWGAQIGTAYGEPFVCKEQIAFRDPLNILEA